MLNAILLNFQGQDENKSPQGGGGGGGGGGGTWDLDIKSNPILS